MASSSLVQSPQRTPARQSCASSSVSSPTLMSPLGQSQKTPMSLSSVNTERIQKSPLRLAASLIQSLEIHHTEMMGNAANAAKDAETARKNAQTAEMLIQKYQRKSYPASKTVTRASPASLVDSITNTTVTPSKLLLTPRTKLPEARRLHSLTPNRASTTNRLPSHNEDAKETDDHKENQNDNESTSITTPVASKPTNGRPPSSAKVLSAPQSPTPYQRIQNRLTPQSPTSYERLAKNHADDLLQLQLELERTRQELKSEQQVHKKCQASLESMKESKMKADRKVKKILNEFQIEREELSTKISKLENELEASLWKLQAAEEDAQLALDIARDSADEREKAEEQLEAAKNEIDFLRNGQDGKAQNPALTTPKRSVHFADTEVTTANGTVTPSSTPVQPKEQASPMFYTPRETGPPRAMVAAGRQLLLRRNMTPQDAVIRLEVSPAKSAERRQQLCRRLNKHLNEGGSENSNMSLVNSSSSSLTPLSPTSGSGLSISDGITKKKLEEYNSAMKILQISGKRLELDGYWWREQSNKTLAPNNNPVQIDIITRQYCQNVEVRISMW